MKWSPRVKPTKIRKLYRLQKRGADSERVMLDVGWSLHALCGDVVTAVTGLQLGEIPCPNCDAAVQRKGVRPPTAEDRDILLRDYHRVGWFHCEHCRSRLLWRDCRDALRREPRCFSCRRILRNRKGILSCDCGESWDIPRYRASVTRRLLLPCPKCRGILRRPTIPHRPTADGMAISRTETFGCTKCKSLARRSGGYVSCASCGHKVRWRSYKKNLKQRDELLACRQCSHRFRWQEWRQAARRYSTGNPGPASGFLKEWPASKLPDQQMMQIDILIQALHGQGALAPVFIEGSKESVRGLLDELAELA